jgi:hypothetical protein
MEHRVRFSFTIVPTDAAALVIAFDWLWLASKDPFRAKPTTLAFRGFTSMAEVECRSKM